MRSFIRFIKILAVIAALVYVVSRLVEVPSVAKSKPVKSAKLKVKNISRTLSKRLGTVLEKMQHGTSYSQMELAELVGISYRSVRRYVDQLVKLSLVKVSGRTSATRITKL